MTIFERIYRFAARSSGSVLASLIEAIKTAFSGDPELRRRVAFSVAIIALSAKMAKADGIVTQDEVRAFQEIFSVPPEEQRNVARLYDLARQDVAGFEAYAQQMAGLCGSGARNCQILEDILDALFHIAKADGVLHEDEQSFLQRVAEIFEVDQSHYARIEARHVLGANANPYTVLGVSENATLADIKKSYRLLVVEHHPDRMIARGVPEEFVSIANTRLAALNAAYEQIEKDRRLL